jgi:hypothetical protein
VGLIQLKNSPGVERDGTVLASQAYTNAQWCRWQRGLPRKMGGYRVTQPYLTAVSRALITQAQNGFRYVTSGHANGLDQFTMDNSAVSSTVSNPVFPATTHPTTAGLTPSPLNTWQFDTQFDNLSGNTLLFSFCGQNLLDPTNSAQFPVYYQNVYVPGQAPTQVQGFGTGSDGHGGTQQALFPNGISGGLVSLAPYLIVYGSNGFFAWSTPGFPTDFVGTQLGSVFVGATEITNQKIMRGLPLRGGGGFSPNGIFWSVDSVVRATFIGITNGTWQFDQLTTQSSLLSDRCVVENDGTFYWAGVDRFLQFNGVVREIPNAMNLNWFFDNINPANSAKSFVMKIPRYGEIWWCFPFGSSTECNWAVIYNYREQSWYDTPLPNTGRSSGLHADNLVGNIMGGILPYVSSISGTPTTYFNLWDHEQGKDEINGTVPVSILSSFTTSALTNFSADPPNDATLTISSIQPDILQSGDMTVTALKQNNANSAIYQGNTATIYDNSQVPPPGVTTTPLDEITNLKDTAKIIYLQFQSNVLGGDYQLGKIMAQVDSDGARDT